MWLLVFLAITSLCQCFNPLLEANNAGYGLPQQYIFGKDEFLKRLGMQPPVSYANPFLRYQYHSPPISFGYPQYFNKIGQYGSIAPPSNPLLNKIPISNNNGAFVKNPQIFPPVPPIQENVLKASSPLDDGRRSINDFKDIEPELPTTSVDTPKGGRRQGGSSHWQSMFSMNNEISGIRNIGQNETYYDLINQILKGTDSGQNTVNKDLKIYNDAEEILNYIIELMLSEKHLSPDLIKVLNSARKIDFSKLDEIDQTQLIKLNKHDIYYLKQYLMRILNTFGLTTYTFNLLEYTYLIEGIPKSEIHLILKILTNVGAPQKFNRNDLQLLKRHLHRIYEDFSESPHILVFLRNILNTQFSPTKNNVFDILDIEFGTNYKRNKELEIITFIVKIMISENDISPNIIRVLNSAQNIDFSTLHKTRLVQVSNKDVERLKTYFVQVVDLYGLNTYTFKLMEYIFLLEGRPKIESYLMFLILSDNTVLKQFNKNQVKLIKEHLLQIYTNYNESTHILEFLNDILDQLKSIENDNQINTDLNDNDVKNDVQEIYLLLSQTYNNNPDVLKILKIINNLYGYVESNVLLPVIDQNDLQSLTTLRPEDLNLLVKYILQVISQRGVSIYLNGLLSYINWIQKSKTNPSNESDEKVDLSPIYQYLLEPNRAVYSKNIILILNSLSLDQNFNFPVTTMNSIESLGFGDLIRIKEFLLHNGNNELSTVILDFVDKLNQAIQKQEVKVILEGNHNLVEIIPDDLELLKQYMISKQTVIPNYYLNEILQIIHQALNQKAENGIGKIKYFDLMQIYKYLLQTQIEDKDNPVLIMVQRYVNENNKDLNIKKDSNYNKPDVNIIVINNIVHDNQINLEELYKFLSYNSDKSNPLLLDLLKYFKQTLILPNGELKIKIIALNSTTLAEQNSLNYLKELLAYLVNRKENSEAVNNYLYAELLKYLKNQLLEKDHRVQTNPLYLFPIDALYRINQFLNIFIKQSGENDYVYKMILQINEILKSQKIEGNPQVIHDLNVRQEDLNILLQYLREYVPDWNTDIKKLVEFIRKTEELMKYQKNEKRQEYVTILQFIDNAEITPVVKDILLYIIVDKMYEDPNLLIIELTKSHVLDKLDTSEIVELIKYLQIIKSMIGANQSIGILIDNIIRLKNEIELNKIGITTPRDELIPDNKKDLNILINSNEINLEEVYKVLLLNSIYDKWNPLLLELLKYFNQTLISPNGELKIKIISINSTKPADLISQDYLKELLAYLVNHKENSEAINNYLYTELLKYLKNQFLEKDNKVQTNPLYLFPVDALYRINQFLNIFIKQSGENNYVYKMILQINEILKSQKIEGNPQVIHDLNVRQEDLNILLQYLREYVPDWNTDIKKLVEFIRKTEELMKYQKNEKRQEYVTILQFIDNAEITPVVKDILLYIIVDKMYEDPNLLIMELTKSHVLDKLDTSEIVELIKYLQIIKSMIGANQSFGILIDNIIRLKNEIELNKIGITTPRDELIPDNKKDLNILINSNEINLEEVYKVLLLNSNSDKSNPLLLELLKYFNQTLISPNGELKIKIISINSTKPADLISQDYLKELLAYLVNHKENSEAVNNYLYAELLKYLKNQFLEKDHKVQTNLLYLFPIDSLYRINQFLNIFIKQSGENDYVYKMILQINEILKSQKIEGNPQVINDLNVRQEDLNILLQYLEKYVPDWNTDIKKLVEFIRKTEELMKYQKNEKWQEYVTILQFIDNAEITPVVKDILLYIIVDKMYEDPNLLIMELTKSHVLDKLDTSEIVEFIKYLQIIESMIGANQSFGILIDNIIRLKNEIELNKIGITTPRDELIPDNKKDLNILINSNEINLEEVYKVLLLNSNSDKSNPLLLELLKYFNQTLISPNGELKIKIISINSTKPADLISQDYLKELLAYLVNHKENSEAVNNYLYAELLKYLKNQFLEKDHKVQTNLLYLFPIDSLYRINQFLNIFIKQSGENDYVYKMILQINEILKSQKIEGNPQVINDLNVRQEDLNILLQYLEKYVPDWNTDIKKLVEFIRKTEELMKYQKNEKWQEYVTILQFIDNAEITPVVKDILLYIIVDKMYEDPNLLIMELTKSHVLDKLDTSEIVEFIKYLQITKSMIGANQSFGILIDNIIRLKNEIELNKIGITTPRDELIPDNKKDLNILINSNEINLEEVYKVLLLNSNSDKSNPLLLELLKYFNQTLISPNGELKIKIISINSTKPADLISQDYLKELLAYLVNHKENSEAVNNYLYAELLKYLKNQFLEKDHKVQTNLLYLFPIDSLYRINQFLNIFIKQSGENDYVYKMILQINEILKSQKIEGNPQVINNLNVRQEDLNILLQYLEKYVPDWNTDIKKLVEFIRKTEELMKYPKNEKWREYVTILQFIDNAEITPVVKDILLYIIVDKMYEDPNLLMTELTISHALDKLDTGEMVELIKYLQIIKSMIVVNQSFGILIDNIIRLKNEIELNKIGITTPKDELIPDNKKDLNVLINSNEINLEEVYKVLLLNSNSDKSNPLLLELLKYFNQTLISPNGELKIKIISINSTKPADLISQDYLKELLVYLVNHKENSEAVNNYFYAELLKYLKKQFLDKDHEVQSNPLYLIPIDALYRINQYLNMFIKQNGENDYVYQIILQINEILKSQKIEGNPQVIQDFNIKKDDLSILLQYLREYVPDWNNDILKLFEYIRKTEELMKYQKNEQRLEYVTILQFIDNAEITPVLKDILLFIIVDKRYEDPNLLIMELKKSHMLDKLDTSEIVELTKYLQIFKSMFGANQSFGILIDNVIRLKNEIELNKIGVTSPKDELIPEHVKENIKDLKISIDNVKMINKYLIDLFGQYGTDEDVVHIIYKIYHLINDESFKNIDLPKLILGFNNKALILNTDDIRNISKDLINLIERHGMDQRLMKLLRVIFNFNTTNVKDKQMSVLGVNDTHVEVAIDQKSLDQMQQYFNTIAKYYKLNPNKLNILPILYPTQSILSGHGRDNTKLHNGYTLMIRHGEIEQLTKYILELIRRHGMLPELMNVLLFVCDIYGDDKMATMTVNNEKKQNDLVIPDEMKVLLQQGVIQNIQNMDTVNLKKLYMQIIQKVFAMPNNAQKGDMKLSIAILLSMYKNEVMPVNKYILLSLLNYLKNNKDVSYEALWQPDFVILLMNLMNTTSTVSPNTLDNVSNGHEKYVIVLPYDYKSDIEGPFGKLIKKLYQPVNPNETDKKILTNYNIAEQINNAIRGLTDSNHKVEHIHKPLDRIEKNMANYTIYEVSKDGILRQSNIEKGNVQKPINTTEQNKNIGANNTVKSNTKEEKNYQPDDANEENKNNMANNNIDTISNNGIDGSIQPKRNLEKIDESLDKNNNIVVSSTIYEINKDGNSGQWQHYHKDVSCEEANKKFDLILQHVSSSNEQNIDLSREEFLKLYDILDKFKKRLSLESQNEVVTSSALIRELEQRLLQNNVDTCKYQPNFIVKKFISDLAGFLRQMIKYMTKNRYDDLRMQTIVTTLADTMMANIIEIAVNDCKVQTPKELMRILFSDVYSSDDLEDTEIEFPAGYTLHGDTEEDFLQALPMQKLQQEIAEYKKM